MTLLGAWGWSIDIWSAFAGEGLVYRASRGGVTIVERGASAGEVAPRIFERCLAA